MELDIEELDEPDPLVDDGVGLPMPEGPTLRDYQIRAKEAIYAGWKDYSRQLVVMATGTGKCLGRGTPVLKYDGTIVPVETIAAGDLLMGPDSTARKVTSVCQGREMLYRVKPKKGTPYVVNESHILSLRVTNCGRRSTSCTGRKYRAGEIANVGVLDYLSASTTFRHCAKSWRSGVLFRHEDTDRDLPPYLLGLWLGDGHSKGPTFTTGDSEVAKEVMLYAHRRGLKATHEQGRGCTNIHIRQRRRTGRGPGTNNLLNALRRFGLINNKHIPHLYKANDVTIRLEVLAGLLDTDGSLSSNCYDYISKVERLADDVCFVARSLGMAAYKTESLKSCQTGSVGLYYRVSISGNVDTIPCRIKKKRAAIRRQKKDALVSAITVESVGYGDYFGFEISGTDRLFLLGDFTVTHNTVLFSSIAADEVAVETAEEVARGGKVLIVAHTEELLDQAADKLTRVTGIVSEREKAEEYASTGAAVVIASIQTLSKDERLTAFPPDHFSLVIVDECHRILARSYLKVVYYFHFGEASLDESWVMPEPGAAYKRGARVLGFTATDDRGDRRSLGQIFEHCAFEYGLLDACRDGYLVRPVVKQFPLKVDMQGVRIRGRDLDAHEISQRLTPFLMEIAKKVAEEARERKTIIWLPSVDSATRLSEALRGAGMNASFVSGACPDRAEKITAFRAVGPGSVMCNAMLLNEGVDIADVNCCMMLRPTKIRSLAVQAYGRGTRVLPGVIDGLETKEERLRAIAASLKPDMLILDVLWLTDRLDLIKPVDLVAQRADMRDRMQELQKEGEKYDLLDLEGVATRDLLKSLEAAARRTAHREARVLDPLAWAVDLGDEKLATYEPETDFDRRPATKGQLDFLQRQHFDVEKIRCFGQASMIIGKMMQRFKLNLATPQQLNFLHKLVPAKPSDALLSKADCTVHIDAALKAKKAKAATGG
jgi:superfamily II DNA or RNA helicase